ncbi:MAG: hypothetical protein ABI682_10485 [Acidobacteriota bacterium]
MSGRFRSLTLATFLISIGSTLLAQVLTVGFNGGGPSYAGNVSATVPQTTLQLASAASVAGDITTATFGWSASPCPAAVKIKFFRPFNFIDSGPGYIFLTERGPFDVAQPMQSSSLYPPVTQTVNLTPAVALRKGDVIAITNLTTCGGPTYVADLPSPLPPWAPSSLTVPGDVKADIRTHSLGRPVFVTAFGVTRVLPLLGGRFHVTMIATDPRSGVTAFGVPNQNGDRAGYFALPDLTGDSHFPEVTVKMLDATSSPALGGNFWFFHAPLTDVSYTLTVTDSVRGTSRTYSSSPGSPGQLCGGVDTSAFLP